MSEKLEPFVFFREGHFYVVEIPRSHVAENVKLNPGTVRVEDIKGNIVWPLSMTDRDIIERLRDRSDHYLADWASAAMKEAADTIERLTAREQAAREFVKRHPALTLIDLAEFESFLKMPETLAALSDGGGDGRA